MRSRILFVFASLGLIWSVLVLRGGQLQLLPHQQIQSRQKQFQTRIQMDARRGAIVDRKGRDLALSIKGVSLFADPSLIESPRWLSKKLAPIVGVPSEVLFKKMKDSDRQFVWLARKLETDKKIKIQNIGVKGLGFIDEYRRVYPNDSLLASSIGLTGAEGQGLEGLELSQDSLLKGESRSLALRRDARGRPLVDDALEYSQVPEGQELQLSIDSEIQHELERELQDTTKSFDAVQAFGVILEVATGEVVALASTPGFDANRANLVKPDRRRNRNITDVFEPGSVLKTFAIAAAIEELKVQPRTRIKTEFGKIKVGDRWIREADATHNWESLSVAEILAYSSNVGTSKIAMMLGDQKLRDYFEKFGFGNKTGIELKGESKGSLLPLPWNDHLLSNIAFGQGVATTPIQVAAAYLSVASGGIWRAPKLIRAVKNPDTGEVKEWPSHPERRVLKTETALAVRLMLVGATSDKGTGENARVEGFMVGGKTGTAQKVDTQKGGYLEGAYISSFAGFIPATEPKYVIYISVDHPKKNSYYGSHVAAPVFSRIANYMARLEGWAPSNLKKAGNENVHHRISAALTKVPEKRDFSNSVPDLTNLTLREVLQDLQSHPIELRVVGSGVVHETSPRRGQSWGRKKMLTLFMKPDPVPGHRSLEPSSEGSLLGSLLPLTSGDHNSATAQLFVNEGADHDADAKNQRDDSSSIDQREAFEKLKTQ